MTLVSTPIDPVPAGANVDWLTAQDGTRLRVARWCPDGATRGTVVIANGRTEFIEKYFEMIGDLLERGFAVATLDWRGQGLSDRPLENRQKGWVESFDLYVSDLRHFVERFLSPSCPAPYHVFAHSMGGNVTLRYLSEHPDTFESAIFSAPMWGIGKSERPSFVLRAVSGLTNVLGLGSFYAGRNGDYGEASRVFDGNVLTQDRERFDRFHAQIAAEPRLALGTATLGWVHRAIASIDVLHGARFAESVRIPIRVCSAGADGIVSNAAHAALVSRLPDAEHVVIEGARHELMVELDRYREQVLAQFDAI